MPAIVPYFEMPRKPVTTPTEAERYILAFLPSLREYLRATFGAAKGDALLPLTVQDEGVSRLVAAEQETPKSPSTEQAVSAKEYALAPNPLGLVAPYGCGAYGCVFKCAEPGNVIKLTFDATEAYLVYHVLRNGWQVPGLILYHAVVSLPVLKGNRRAYIIWREEAQEIGRDAVKSIKMEWNDPTADYIYRCSTVCFLISRSLVMGFYDAARKLNNDAFWYRTACWQEQTEIMLKAAIEEKLTNTPVIGEHWGKDPSGRPSVHFAPSVAPSLRITRMLCEAYNIGHPDEHSVAEGVEASVGADLSSAYAYLWERGILLGDIHFDNIGFRCGSLRGQGPCIVDPGHMMPFWEELGQADMARLPRPVPRFVRTPRRPWIAGPRLPYEGD